MEQVKIDNKPVICPMVGHSIRLYAHQIVVLQLSPKDGQGLFTATEKTVMTSKYSVLSGKEYLVSLDRQQKDTIYILTRIV